MHPSFAVVMGASPILREQLPPQPGLAAFHRPIVVGDHQPAQCREQQAEQQAIRADLPVIGDKGASAVGRQRPDALPDQIARRLDRPAIRQISGQKLALPGESVRQLALGQHLNGPADTARVALCDRMTR